MAGSVRLSEEDPFNQELKDLQLKMNEMLRIILNVKRKDKVSVKSMLDKCEMLSVNQIICKTILLEMWKALKNNILPISGSFQKRDNIRFQHLFKTSENPNSFISVASKLYEKTSRKFQETEWLSIPKVEAHTLAQSLPI